MFPVQSGIDRYWALVESFEQVLREYGKGQYSYVDLQYSYELLVKAVFEGICQRKWGINAWNHTMRIGYQFRLGRKMGN